MDQKKFLPEDFFPDRKDRHDRKDQDDHIHDQKNGIDRHKLFGDRADTGDRMREQKFRGMDVLFFHERGNTDDRREERAAQAEYVSRLYGIKSDQRSEVEFIHTECLRKTAHRGKQLIDIAHLRLHFRKHQDAHGDHEADRKAPDQCRGLL